MNVYNRFSCAISVSIRKSRGKQEKNTQRRNWKTIKLTRFQAIYYGVSLYFLMLFLCRHAKNSSSVIQRIYSCCSHASYLVISIRSSLEIVHLKKKLLSNKKINVNIYMARHQIRKWKKHEHIVQGNVQKVLRSEKKKRETNKKNVLFTCGMTCDISYL